MNLYDVARQVTDEVFGKGTYAEMNKDNPDPEVQRAIEDEPKHIVSNWGRPIQGPGYACTCGLIEKGLKDHTPDCPRYRP